jgi:hypothetical protein
VHVQRQLDFGEGALGNVDGPKRVGTTQQRALRYVCRHHDARLESASNSHHCPVHHCAVNDSRNDCSQHSFVNCNHTFHHRDGCVGNNLADIHHAGIGRLARNDSTRRVLHTRGRIGYLWRSYLCVFENRRKGHALLQRLKAVASTDVVDSTTLNAYVQEDQEAQGAHAPLQSKSRQASQHGPPLIALK